MKPQQALALRERLNREIGGLRQMLDQLEAPGTGSTMAGLKSGLCILARSLARTNQILHDTVRAEVEAPSRNPFEGLFSHR